MFGGLQLLGQGSYRSGVLLLAALLKNRRTSGLHVHFAEETGDGS